MRGFTALMQYFRTPEISLFVFVVAVGFSSGRVTIIDGLTLIDNGDDVTKSDFYHCHDSILKLTFSYDSRFLASSVSTTIKETYHDPLRH